MTTDHRYPEEVKADDCKRKLDKLEHHNCENNKDKPCKCNK